jgi:hypothetical protein
MKSKANQLLKENNIEFWGNDIWLGNFSDLNAAEHIGSILKDEAETKNASRVWT